MTTLANNIIFISVIAFAAGLVVFGLLNHVKALKDNTSPWERILASLGAALGAGIVVWFAVDFSGDRTFLVTLDKWITAFLNEPLGTVIIKSD